MNLGAPTLLAAGTGSITFSKAVAGVVAGASLTVTGTGTTNINGGSVTTLDADQSYGEIINFNPSLALTALVISR